MILDQCFDIFQLLARKPVIPGQLDFRLKPVPGLTISSDNVYMFSLFLSGEKETSAASFLEFRGTHFTGCSLIQLSNSDSKVPDTCC